MSGPGPGPLGPVRVRTRVRRVQDRPLDSLLEPEGLGRQATSHRVRRQLGSIGKYGLCPLFLKLRKNAEIDDLGLTSFYRVPVGPEFRTTKETGHHVSA